MRRQALGILAGALALTAALGVSPGQAQPAAPAGESDAPGPTQQLLPGGGHELITYFPDGRQVHEVYGPDVNGQSSLLTTYTAMPSSSLTMNSTAANSGVLPPTTTTPLPSGGLEVVYPSEFVPGASIHTIYGPENPNTHNRSMITSFLQPHAVNSTPGVQTGGDGGSPSGTSGNTNTAVANGPTAGNDGAPGPTQVLLPGGGHELITYFPDGHQLHQVYGPDGKGQATLLNTYTVLPMSNGPTPDGAPGPTQRLLPGGGHELITYFPDGHQVHQVYGPDAKGQSTLQNTYTVMPSNGPTVGINNTPGPTQQLLPGGGHELITYFPDGRQVHQVYGPDQKGQTTLLTTYTAMPSTGLTMNSTAAISGPLPPTTTTVLPGGGLEVVYPSEFVPGVSVHTIYGPENPNTHDRSAVTTFLQPHAVNSTPGNINSATADGAPGPTQILLPGGGYERITYFNDGHQLHEVYGPDEKGRLKPLKTYTVSPFRAANATSSGGGAVNATTTGGNDQPKGFGAEEKLPVKSGGGEDIKNTDTGAAVENGKSKADSRKQSMGVEKGAPSELRIGGKKGMPADKGTNQVELHKRAVVGNTGRADSGTNKVDLHKEAVGVKAGASVSNVTNKVELHKEAIGDNKSVASIAAAKSESIAARLDAVSKAGNLSSTKTAPKKP